MYEINEICSRYFGHGEGMKKPNLKAELLWVWQHPFGFPLDWINYHN